MAKEFYDNVVAKVEYKGEQGSGVLLLNGNQKNTLLITAWHCLKYESEINFDELRLFRQIEDKLVPLLLSCSRMIKIEECDIAIVVINEIFDIPEYATINHLTGDEGMLVGFPKALADNRNGFVRYPLSIRTIELSSTGRVIIESSVSLDSFEKDAKANVNGFSGAGIWRYVNGKYILGGIVTDLTTPTGTFSSLKGIAIDEIIERTSKEINWDVTVGKFLEYKDNLLSGFDEPLLEVFAHQVPIVDTNVTPKDIINHCGKKLVWPYSKQDLNEKVIWETWLLYLIIRCIEDQKNLQNDTFYMIETESGSKKVKVIYDTESKKISLFLKSYLEHIYSGETRSELVILKSKENMYSTFISNKVVNNVVADVGKVINQKKGIYVDEVINNLDVTVLHINELIHKIEEVANEEENQNITAKDLEAKLKIKIKEILYGI